MVPLILFLSMPGQILCKSERFPLENVFLNHFLLEGSLWLYQMVRRDA